MKYGYMALLCAVTALVACKPPEAQVDGQVFIVTKGRENVKLGAVDVVVFTEESIKPAVAKRLLEGQEKLKQLQPKLDAAVAARKQAREAHKAATATAERIISRWSGGSFGPYEDARKRAEELYKPRRAAEQAVEDVKKEIRDLLEADFLLRNLAQAVAVAQTDADGRFSFKKLKPGRYAVAAKSSRKVGSDTEEYGWLVWVDAKPEQPVQVYLSSNNMISDFCDSCVYEFEATKKLASPAIVAVSMVDP